MRRLVAPWLLSLLLASCVSATPTLPSPAGTSSNTSEPTQLAMAKRWTLGPVADIAVSADAAYVLHSPTNSQGALSNATDTRLARIDRASGRVATAGPFPFAMR